MPQSLAKRLILQTDLRGHDRIEVQPDLAYWPWSPSLLADHAMALFHSFQNSADLAHYPSLASEPGCRDLFHDLTSLPQFCPAATWLVKTDGPIGTISALIHPETGWGEIQNLGVVLTHRRHGFAGGLLSRCLSGLRESGCQRVTLEVSANNEPALHLYRNFGFHPYKTVYAPIRAVIPDTGSGI